MKYLHVISIYFFLSFVIVKMWIFFVDFMILPVDGRSFWSIRSRRVSCAARSGRGSGENLTGENSGIPGGAFRSGSVFNDFAPAVINRNKLYINKKEEKSWLVLCLGVLCHKKKKLQMKRQLIIKCMYQWITCLYSVWVFKNNF